LTAEKQGQFPGMAIVELLTGLSGPTNETGK